MSDPAPKRRRAIPIIRRKAPPGSRPGTLTVDPAAPKPHLSAIGYGPDDYTEVELDTPDAIAPLRGRWPVLWVNVDGLGDPEVLQKIGDAFHIHRLALEDVVNVPQRAKFESYEEHSFLIGRMMRYRDGIDTEQISMIIGDGYLLTFQERRGDPFGPVRDRLRDPRGRLRSSGPDYLAYALLDALIDGYYPLLEAYGERIEALEEEVLAGHETDIGARIHAIKRELLMIRRTLIPHRELLHGLQRQTNTFITEATQVYLRDCYDHVVQLVEMVETYRELTSGLLDVHLTTVSNRMNEVMKVLTIFAAIFIPLSFIAGLYGMNFDQESPWNMPELRWAFGYPALLIVMAVVTIGLLVFFRRRGWIGGPRPPRPPRDAEKR